MTCFCTIDAALSQIKDYSTLAIGGMTLYRRPVGLIREMIRRETQPQGLTLLAFTAGLESDLLIGAGCISKVRTVYFGLESFGLAPMFTQAAQVGAIEIIEETEASIVMGLRATMSGVGFMPSHAWIGTDLPHLRPDVDLIHDPYSGEELMAFPAIPIDVTMLHGLAADQHGNVLLNNNLGIDLELVYAAKTVIVTVEEMVDRIEKSLSGTILPAPGADYIVHLPNGAWPTSCYPNYIVDGEEIIRYVEYCNAGQFDEYMQSAND